MRLRAIFSAFTDSLVMIMIVTFTTAIIAIYPYTAIHYRTTWIACIIIAILGFITISRQLYRQYHWERARDLINELLVQGRIITDDVQQNCDKTPKGEKMIDDWCKQVEGVLRKHLTDAYVMRFHQGGSNLAPPKEMTAFKNNFRLETLATFLLELRP